MTTTPRRLLALLCLLAPAPAADALGIIRYLWPQLPGGPVVESVEWMTGDADLVVRARIVDATPLPPADGLAFVKVNVEVVETYAKSDRVAPDLPPVIAVATWGPTLAPAAASAPDRWHARPGHEVLLFLDHRSRISPAADPVPGCDFVVRRHGGYLAARRAEQAVRLDGADGVATVAHEWLTEPYRIIGRVEEAARAGRGAPRAEIAEDGRPAQRLIVPANRLLERRARFLAIDGDVRPGVDGEYEAYARRLWGVRLLAQCRSPAAERALRFLLDDDRARGNVGIGRRQTYPLREAARDVLAGWGVDVSSAIVEEPTDWYRPIGRTALGVALLVLALALAPALRARRPDRPPPRRLRAAVTALFTLLALIAASFWLRSLSGVDSVRHATPARLCELTSYQGRVQLRLDPNHRGAPGLAAARFHPARPDDQAAWDPTALPVPAAWQHAGLARAVDDQSDAAPIHILVIPHAWITALLIAWPALHLAAHARHRLRQRRRRKRGLCPACGYDCRATPTACPECGHALPV